MEKKDLLKMLSAASPEAREVLSKIEEMKINELPEDFFLRLGLLARGINCAPGSRPAELEGLMALAIMIKDEKEDLSKMALAGRLVFLAAKGVLCELTGDEKLEQFRVMRETIATMEKEHTH